MTALEKQVCEACRPDAPRVTEAEMQELLGDLPEWEVVDQGGIKQLQRVFSFPDFAGALAFTQRVGELAEHQQHHPAILTEWGQVTVTWWTHKIKGLHKNDFIMAAKTEALA